MTMAGVQKRPAFVLYHHIWIAIDWLYPPACGGCGKSGERWCRQCQELCTRIPQSCCQICGVPLPSPGICASCQETPPNYTACRSFAVYEGPLREAIHQLKYQRDIGLGEALAVHLIELLTSLPWHIDLITPVPLSPKRLKERGYNQAGLLAYPVALSSRIPYSARAIRRIRETHSQVGLSAAERSQNLLGAFQAKPEIVMGKSVLVIDDVTTTGSTLMGCTQALLNSGAVAVYGITLAKAMHQQAL